MRNIVYLEHIGLTGPNLILAHCIWLDEQEKEILRKHRVKVSHCPGSNLKLASGIAEDLGIKHASPQILYFKDKEPVWNTSHWSVTAKHMSAVRDDCRIGMNTEQIN